MQSKAFQIFLDKLARWRSTVLQICIGTVRADLANLLASNVNSVQTESPNPNPNWKPKAKAISPASRPLGQSNLCVRRVCGKWILKHRINNILYFYKSNSLPMQSEWIPSFSISVCVCVCLWVLHLEDILLRYGINSTHLHSVRLFDLPLSRAQSFVDRTLWLWLAQPWHTLYVCYWVSVCAPHTHTHTHTHPRSCCICHRL